MPGPKLLEGQQPIRGLAFPCSFLLEIQFQMAYPNCTLFAYTVSIKLLVYDQHIKKNALFEPQPSFPFTDFHPITNSAIRDSTIQTFDWSIISAQTAAYMIPKKWSSRWEKNA